VTDDGEEHDDGMGGDAITPSSSLLGDRGVSHYDGCVYARIYMYLI